MEQKYQYNGIELLDDWGLNLNTARYRTLDPQLGRWWQIDPKVETFEAWSAYNSNLDNPIRYEDKDGDTPGGGDKNDKTLHPAFTPEGGFCGGGSFGGCNSFRNSGSWSKPNASSKLTMAPRVAPKPAANKGGKTFTTVETEAGDNREVSTYKELRDAKLKDGHHAIQDAAVKDIPGYNKNDAPAVRLDGPSYKIGSEHYNATQVQRKEGGGTYASERRIGYKALRTAGLTKEGAREVIKTADAYFKSLGVTPSTPTRIPGNRKK